MEKPHVKFCYISRQTLLYVFIVTFMNIPLYFIYIVYACVCVCLFS